MSMYKKKCSMVVRQTWIDIRTDGQGNLQRLLRAQEYYTNLFDAINIFHEEYMEFNELSLKEKDELIFQETRRYCTYVTQRICSSRDYTSGLSA